MSRMCLVASLLVLSLIFMLGSLVVTFGARFWLRGFYYTAHMSALSVIVCVFVFFHHIVAWRQVLGCGERFYVCFQTIVNILFLIATMTASIMLVASACFHTLHLNHDFLLAGCWGFIDCLLLTHLVVDAARHVREHNFYAYTLQQPDWTKTASELEGHEMEHLRRDMNPANFNQNCNSVTVKVHQQGVIDNVVHYDLRNVNSNNSTSRLHVIDDESEPYCRRCCICLGRIILGFFYFLLLVILLLIFCLTALQASCLLKDHVEFSPKTHQVSVELSKHRPLGLYLRCRGTGNTTVLFENGLGGMALLLWEFLPKQIAKHGYRACVYDRRGYGWSEGYPHDYIGLREEQSSEENALFAHELAKEAGLLSSPLYLAGFSYGGHHITWFALKYPEAVKGLIYLDSSSIPGKHASTDEGFGGKKGLKLDIWQYLNLAANMAPLGLFRVASMLRLVDYRELLKKQEIAAAEIPEDIFSEWAASMDSGFYFESFGRENRYHRDQEKLEFGTLRTSLKDRTIDKPVLVFNAETDTSFPEDIFTCYNSSFNKFFPRLTHNTLVFTSNNVSEVGGLIATFIEADQSATIKCINAC